MNEQMRLWHDQQVRRFAKAINEWSRLEYGESVAWRGIGEEDFEDCRKGAIAQFSQKMVFLKEVQNGKYHG